MAEEKRRLVKEMSIEEERRLEEKREAEPWWLWVDDDSNKRIYHSEYFTLHKKQKDEDLKVTLIMPTSFL